MTSQRRLGEHLVLRDGRFAASSGGGSAASICVAAAAYSSWGLAAGWRLEGWPQSSFQPYVSSYARPAWAGRLRRTCTLFARRS